MIINIDIIFNNRAQFSVILGHKYLKWSYFVKHFPENKKQNFLLFYNLCYCVYFALM